jgi:hypothetical protein
MSGMSGMSDLCPRARGVVGGARGVLGGLRWPWAVTLVARVTLTYFIRFQVSRGKSRYALGWVR